MDGEREGEERKNRKTVQIFVKVYELKEFLMDVSLTDQSKCHCKTDSEQR